MNDGIGQTQVETVTEDGDAEGRPQVWLIEAGEGASGTARPEDCSRQKRPRTVLAVVGVHEKALWLRRQLGMPPQVQRVVDLLPELVLIGYYTVFNVLRQFVTKKVRSNNGNKEVRFR